jgi:1-acyl-sn-glycerol-3-phosphate acyltransferase
MSSNPHNDPAFAQGASGVDTHNEPATASPLRWLYENVVMFIGWPLFALLCAIATTRMILFSLFLRGTDRKLSNRYAGAWVFKTILRYLELTGLARFDLRALESLQGERGIILAPNHPSLLDAVLVASKLDTVTCIMKAKISSNPVLGIGARLMGYVGNDSPATMVKQSIATLKAGQQLLLFPEGTRTVHGNINPLRGAVALIAKKSKAPVQTLIIESNSRFFGKEWPLLKRPKLPLHYRVRLGKRFEPMDDNQAFLAQLEEHYRNEVGKK